MCIARCNPSRQQITLGIWGCRAEWDGFRRAHIHTTPPSLQPRPHRVLGGCGGGGGEEREEEEGGGRREGQDLHTKRQGPLAWREACILSDSSGNNYSTIQEIHGKILSVVPNFGLSF